MYVCMYVRTYACMQVGLETRQGEVPDIDIGDENDIADNDDVAKTTQQSAGSGLFSMFKSFVVDKLDPYLLLLMTACIYHTCIRIHVTFVCAFMYIFMQIYVLAYLNNYLFMVVWVIDPSLCSISSVNSVISGYLCLCFCV
jgi:hypothetical protein